MGGLFLWRFLESGEWIFAVVVRCLVVGSAELEVSRISSLSSRISPDSRRSSPGGGSAAGGVLVAL
ncbi:hypothetical protein Ae717Ps2_6551c [Pseudonocardia sp. Ae717_Ps2]|nr:hypothetical protein Ae717Ps2_6516c [Pseudonocardia sp. Ae717_Ps2]OLM28331.1 hypothetical protein Ae717Ps2_6533c [Pseudonocardia sp. Ae717_Ps2]OLM28349.1 hypothetical protein Ae717Ps2_6551c [Pseudonocardia sp. Ae717_Ps2]